MSANTYHVAIQGVLKHEGGYTDDQRDAGNWTGGKVGVGRLVGTNMGIAAPTLANWRGGEVTAADMRALELSEVQRIYAKQYADPIQYDRLPAGVDYAVLDFAVNSGVRRASKYLQWVVGAKRDGFIGTNTLAAVRAFVAENGAARLIVELNAKRMDFLMRLKNWKTYGKGWSRRVDDMQNVALRLDKAEPDEAWLANFAPVPGKADGDLKKPIERKIEAAASSIGAAGTMLTEAAKQIEPLVNVSEKFQWVFMGLLVLGIGLTVYSTVTRSQEADA